MRTLRISKIAFPCIIQCICGALNLPLSISTTLSQGLNTAPVQHCNSKLRKRTFSIPDEIDIALKKRAVDDNTRFSTVVEMALREYLGLDKRKKENKK